MIHLACIFAAGFLLGAVAGYLTQRFGLLDVLERWLSKRLGIDIRLCL